MGISGTAVPDWVLIGAVKQALLSSPFPVLFNTFD
jgi:hypothetical protein